MNIISNLFNAKPNISKLIIKNDKSGLFRALTYSKDQNIRESALIALVNIAAYEHEPKLITDSLLKFKPFLTKEIFGTLYSKSISGQWEKYKIASVFEECSKSFGFDVISLLLEQLKDSDRNVLGVCYKAIARLDELDVVSTIKPIVTLAAECKPGDLNGRCILACTNIFLRHPDETVAVLHSQQFSDEEKDRLKVAIGMAKTHSKWDNIKHRWENEGRIKANQNVDIDTILSLPLRSPIPSSIQEQKGNEISFTGKTLIIEFSPKEGKSIDSEASDLASGYVAMRAMGQNKNELLFSILDQVFSSLDIKKIFLTDSVQSAIEAEDSKVTMIVKLDSITQTDKNTIIKMLNSESYHYQKDDTFFKTLLHLSVACYWRDQTCGKSDRKVVFHDSSSSNFSRL